MAQREALQTKTQEVEEMKVLFKEYNIIGVAGLEKVRAAQLQELRRKLKNDASLRVVKNALVRRAIGEVEEKPGLENLKDHMSGSNIFIFTNLNPFKLALLLQRSRVKATARAGDLAAQDVTVPAGNTGLPPGPIISQFGAVGIPTRIEAGSVWINRDTLVVNKGEVITARVASVLSKLGMKPVEIGLTLKVAYEDGLVIPEEQLLFDLEQVRQRFNEAHVHALSLSVNVAYPLAENVPILLQLAYQKAFTLALNAGIPTADTITALLNRAHIEMLSLSTTLAKVTERSGPKTAIEKG
jgi:large subunit ribosomal protein L10